MTNKAGGEGLSAVLPMRAGSTRVKHKNTRDFGGVKGGLASIKIGQLAQVPEITDILIDTDEPDIQAIIDRLGLSKEQSEKIRIEKRNESFAGDEASTDDLIAYLANKVASKWVLWTHVTSPFADETFYSHAIRTCWEKSREGFDSLVSVTSIQEFIWNEDGPVNYDREKEKWPRTQTLPPWYFVNSAAFIIESGLMKARNDRIGGSPYLMKVGKIEGMDIDDVDDFRLAECMYRLKATGQTGK